MEVHPIRGVAQPRTHCSENGSHAIFRYNVLAIDDKHNTWTNMIVKMTILRILGSSDDKEKENRRSKARRTAPTAP